MFVGKPASAKPALLVCYLCGQQFGSSSLPIHQPQCYSKKLTEWKNGNKATRGPKPRNPTEVDLQAPAKITGRNAEEVEEFNRQQFSDFTQQLAQCHNCGRKFFPDRLQVHLRSCKPDASAGGSKPVNGSNFEPSRAKSPSPDRSKGIKPQLLVCYLCGQQFGTQSLPIHIPQCYKKRLIQWTSGDPATRGPKPRDPSTVDINVPTSLGNGMDIDSFNQMNFDQYNSNLSPCPNCARTFNPSALQVHLRSCKAAPGGAPRPSPATTTAAGPPPGGSPNRNQGPAQRPAALVCSLCGQQFGTASLPIHQAQCYKKQLVQWEGADPTTRGPKPRDPATVPVPTSLAGANDFNDQAFNQFQENLSGCPNCGRKFLPDRLQVHMRSCHANASGGGSKPVNRQSADSNAPQMKVEGPEEEVTSVYPERRTSQATPKFGRRSDNAPSPSASTRYADPDTPLLRDRSQMSTPAASSPSASDGNGADGAFGAAEDIHGTPDDQAAEDEEPVHVTLVQCSNCGRRFAEQRLAQHEEVCQRMKKRKPYNMSKHRAEGTALEEVPISRSTANTEVTTKTNWREKHEALKRAMKASREVTACLAKGGKLSDLPPPPPAENPDYVQCPHCSRRFNQAAAERHIPACANTINKPRAPPKRPAAPPAKPPPAAPTPKPSPTPTKSPAKPASKPGPSSPPRDKEGTASIGAASPTLAPKASTSTSAVAKASPPAAAAAQRPRFCSECGYRFEDHVANFCQECGYRRE
eukprot:GGOE01014554.1.p1 GENE.GGOE01014554.1~~GGOE01014554.1.p1  ORF type:complete len:751 (-),score=111.63 GGOE01014554.1:432-2684(-)